MDKYGITGTLNQIWVISGYAFNKMLFSSANRSWTRLAKGEILGHKNIEYFYDLYQLKKYIEKQNNSYTNKSNNTKAKEEFIKNNTVITKAISDLIQKKEEEGDFKILVSGLWQRTTLEFWYQTSLPKAFNGVRVNN
jgi:hypothetical protein